MSQFLFYILTFIRIFIRIEFELNRRIESGNEIFLHLLCFWLSYILWLLKSRSCISRNFVSYWRLKLFMILKTVIGWFTIKLIINFMTLFIPYEVIKVCMLWLLPKEVVGKSDLYASNKRILQRITPVHYWHQINEMTKKLQKNMMSIVILYISKRLFYFDSM